MENLALACIACSLFKGDRVNGVDPDTGKAARMFHPRRDRWNDHFEWKDTYVIGRSEIGRATIEVLHLNRPEVLFIRAEESEWGRHPPPSFDSE